MSEVIEQFTNNLRVTRKNEHKAPGAVTPRCPLRPDEPCRQCQAYATGPGDCGLVYLVMDDPELRELYAQKLAERRN